ncbi:MAG: hypothetical protein V3V13_14210, partial [Paracoccaceae bacterium]
MRFLLGFGVFFATCILGFSTQADGNGDAVPEATQIVPQDVSSNGAFGYSININVPAYHGVEPGISLNYSSTNKAHGTEDNLLGIGWRLGGLGRIERVSPGGGSPFYEDSKDIYTIDGTELLACAAWTKRSYPNDWKVEAETASCSGGGTHSTLNEDFRRYNWATQHWKMYPGDGLKYVYSHPHVMGVPHSNVQAANRLTKFTKFLLDEVRNSQQPSGRATAKYTYYFNPESEGFAARIRQIAYGPYTVKFHYSDRGYDITYATGTSLIGKQHHILTAITVESTDGPIRAYRFIYKRTSDTDRHTLKWVMEYGSDYVLTDGGIAGGTSILPPTRFTYSYDSFAFSKTDFLSMNVDDTTVIADFDNNGIDEIFSPEVDSYRTYVSGGDLNHQYKYTTPSGWYKFDASGGLSETLSIPLPKLVRGCADRGCPASPSIAGIYQTDAGVQHMLIHTNESFKNNGSVNLQSNAGYDLQNLLPLFTMPSSSNSIRRTAPRSFGNFDRDAGAEAFFGIHGFNNNIPYLSDIDDTGIHSKPTQPNGIDLEYITAVIDINGDGISDLIGGEHGDGDRHLALAIPGGYTSSNDDNELPESQSGWAYFYGDVNGDGHTDRIEHRRSGVDYVNVRLSNGIRFSNSTTWLAASSVFNFKENNYGPAKNSIVDVNDDGLGDLIIHNGYSTATQNGDNPRDSLRARVYLSTGHSFVRASNRNGRWVPDYVGVGDFNGDGRFDFVSDNDDGPAHSASIYFGPAHSPNLMTGVSTSEGEAITVAYGSTTANADGDIVVTYSSSEAMRCPGCPPSLVGSPPLKMAPSQKFPGVQQVVASLTRENGRGDSRVFEYSYGVQYWIQELRRFSGFEHVTVKLPALSGEADAIKVRTTYSVTPAGYGTVLATERFSEIADGTETRLSLQRSFFTQRNDQRPYRIQKVMDASQSVYGSDKVETRTTYDYNVYNQPTRISELGYTLASGATRHTFIGYAPNLSPGKFIVDRPAWKQVQASAVLSNNSADWISREQYYYDTRPAFTNFPWRGHLTALKQWDGSGYTTTRTMSYDVYGNLLTETDANNNTTTHTYDATTHLFRTSSTNAAGHVAQSAWNIGCQAPTSTTDINGQTTTFTHDVFCRETAQNYASGGYKNTAYVSFGDPTAQHIAVSVPASNTGTSQTLSYFDGFGQSYKTASTGANSASGSRIVVEQTFDARGNAATTSAPYIPGQGETPLWTSSNYDRLDRPLRTTNADNTHNEVQYITENNRAAIQANTETCFDADTSSVCGQTLSQSDGLGRSLFTKQYDFGGTDEGSAADYRTTTYTHDLADRLTGVIDPNGTTWAYTYNQLGQRTVSNDPDLGQWTMSYDTGGNLLNQTDARGQTIAFTYDNLNRPVTKTVTAVNASVDTITTTYDQPRTGYFNKGQMTTQTSSTGTITYDYAWNGQLARRTTTTNSNLITEVTTFTPSGHATARNLSYDPATGATKTLNITYTYDQSGRLKTIPGYITATSHNARGQITQITYANGATVNNTFNAARGWMDRIEVRDSANTLVFSTDYTHQANGQISSASATDDQGDFSYSYDYAGRLLHADNTTNNAYDRTFTYDAGGNMRS